MKKLNFRGNFYIDFIKITPLFFTKYFWRFKKLMKNRKNHEIDRILYTKPSITSLEIEYVNNAAATGWGEHCYDYIQKFEINFASWLGVKHAVATSSCTGALHLGMSAIGIGPGDEVIIADTNWIASAAPIKHLGATPVFVDILEDTWCIDPKLVEKAITPRTKAIIAVHLYGNLCELKELRELAASHNIFLIEDAAEALGSVYHGARAGSYGDFGVFSFHGSKTMTTGEGGMFVTNDTSLYKNVSTLSNHGRNPLSDKQFWAEKIGFKYRMSNIEAALGCAQLTRIEELIKRKQEILLGYKSRLANEEDVFLNLNQANCTTGAWMPNAVFSRKSGIKRERILSFFKQNNIDARVFFYPLSDMPIFNAVLENKIARDIAARAINLPSFHDITEEEMDLVAGKLIELLRG